MIRIAAITGALFLASGCNSCRKVIAHTKNPDEQTVERLLQEQMPRADKQATKLCGVSVRGLQSLKTQFVDMTAGIVRVKIEGEPITLASSSARASASASHTNESVPPALCLGLLVLTMTPITDSSGNITDWKLSRIEVDEVTTPGHEWKKPESRGKGLG